jgi:RsiW-degrading membrane proteinase PrsW (M82 family)
MMATVTPLNPDGARPAGPRRADQAQAPLPDPPTNSGHRQTSAAQTVNAWRILVTGTLLWALTATVIVLTDLTTLIPTLILLGAFVPAASYAAWAFQHRGTGEVSAPLIFSAFVVGGLLGVLAAGVLESVLIAPGVPAYLGIGMIEEFAKLVGLMVISRGLSRRRRRDGLILGAAVGFGFAAFESAGYAFSALVGTHALDLQGVLQLQVIRGLLAPAGHGLWTGLLGAALFAADRPLRLVTRVTLTYLGVSLLHGLWNAMAGVSVILTLRLTGAEWQYLGLDRVYLADPTRLQSQLLAGLYGTGLLVVLLFGLLAMVAGTRPGRHAATGRVRRAETKARRRARRDPDLHEDVGPDSTNDEATQPAGVS